MCAAQKHAEPSYISTGSIHTTGKEPSLPLANQSKEGKEGACTEALGTSSYMTLSCKATHGSTWLTLHANHTKPNMAFLPQGQPEHPPFGALKSLLALKTSPPHHSRKLGFCISLQGGRKLPVPTPRHELSLLTSALIHTLAFSALLDPGYFNIEASQFLYSRHFSDYRKLWGSQPLTSTGHTAEGRVS